MSLAYKFSIFLGPGGLVRGDRLKKYKSADLVEKDENITVQLVNVHLKNYKSDPHTHDFLEFSYVFSGICRHIVDGREYETAHGDLIFINHGETHDMRLESDLSYANILLNTQFMADELINQENIFSMLSLTSFSEFEPKGFDSRIVSFKGSETGMIDALIKAMYREFTEKQVGYRSVLKGYMQALLSLIFRKMQQREQTRRPAALPGDIIEYIEKNCGERLSLSSLAQKCFYNPSYFSRVFKETTGKTPTEFIAEKRVERAAELLTATDLTAAEISERTGFSDKKQFYRKFKEYYGRTPSEYRKSKNTTQG